MKRLSTNLEEIFANCMYVGGLESGVYKIHSKLNSKKQNKTILSNNKMGRRHEEYMKMENKAVKR